MEERVVPCASLSPDPTDPSSSPPGRRALRPPPPPQQRARRDAPCQYQSSCRGCHCGSCQAVKSSGRHASHAEISALTLYIHPNPFFVGLRAGPCLPALPARSCLRPCLLAFAASVITDSFRRPIQTSVTGWPTTTRTSRRVAATRASARSCQPPGRGLSFRSPLAPKGRTRLVGAASEWSSGDRPRPRQMMPHL